MNVYIHEINTILSFSSSQKRVNRNNSKLSHLSNGRMKDGINNFENCISYIANLYISIALSFEGEL